MLQKNQNAVFVIDSEPIAIEGMRALLGNTASLRFAGALTTLAAGIELVRSLRPAVVVIDKSFGVQAIVDWLTTAGNLFTAPIVWGSHVSNAEALRLMQAGVRAVVQKSSDTTTLLSCLRTVAEGETWLSDVVMQGSPEHRDNLTLRENEVVKLVEKGMRNKEIASVLGIQPGTVKIHLRHIFEKTGCRGRYSLALSGLQGRKVSHNHRNDFPRRPYSANLQ